jgi:peptidoglycan/LPS O-acetylase OafA/YrhL
MTNLFSTTRTESPKDLRYEDLCRAIGILGIAFPFVNLIYDLVFSSTNGLALEMRPTVSCYFWAPGTVWFVGVLWIFGIILVYYTRDKKEGWTATLAGICAFCIAAFPQQASECSPGHIRSSDVFSTIHHLSAVLFFILLSYLSFLFTRKTPDQKQGEDKNKDKRNRIYIVCGAVMVLCLLLAFLYEKFGNGSVSGPFFKPTFVLEAIMLAAFGISWLTRSHYYRILKAPTNG